MTQYLNQDAIPAALFWLRETFDDPMTPAKQEEWEDVLAHLRPGELRAAVGRLATDGRPDPVAVLEDVLANRKTQHPWRKVRLEDIPEWQEARRKVGRG